MAFAIPPMAPTTSVMPITTVRVLVAKLKKMITAPSARAITPKRTENHQYFAPEILNVPIAETMMTIA